MTSDRAARWVAPLVAAGLVVLATLKRGPALSPDSAVYLSVADHLAHGRGWTQFDGAPYVRWAPLYPWLLALGPRLGVAAATVARVLQPLAFAGSVALCGTWLRRHVASARWRVVALALVALSTIGIESAAFVWAESIDIALALGCLVALDAWLSGGRLRVLAAAALCAALACLARYASLVLIPAGVLAIVLAPRPRGGAIASRLLAAAGYALVAAAPIGLWMARNVGLGAGPLGATASSGFSWAALAAQAGNAASHWVSPESSPPAVRAAALALFLIAVAGTLVLGFARAVRDRAPWAPPALMLLFLGAHKTAVLVGAHSTAVEPIEERYLAPLFAPLVLVLAWAADRVTHASARTAPPFAVRGLAALAGLWLAFSILRTADRERGYLGDGAWGFNNARWERSELLATTRTAAPRGLVFSNAPDALYALAHVEAHLWPRRYAYDSPGTPVDDMVRYRAAADSAGVSTLVWFYGLHRDFLVPPAAVLKHPGGPNLGREFRDGLYVESWWRQPPGPRDLQDLHLDSP